MRGVGEEDHDKTEREGSPTGVGERSEARIAVALGAFQRADRARQARVKRKAVLVSRLELQHGNLVAAIGYSQITFLQRIDIFHCQQH